MSLNHVNNLRNEQEGGFIFHHYKHQLPACHYVNTVFVSQHQTVVQSVREKVESDLQIIGHKPATGGRFKAKFVVISADLSLGSVRRQGREHDGKLCPG